jgi:hypothetical protein
VLDSTDHPDWTLWLCGAYLRLGRTCPITPARLDACAEAEPIVALEYAAALLTPALLDACAEARPGAALRYAAALLTPARLDACAEARPWSALEYAAALLTPARLDALQELLGEVENEIYCNGGDEEPADSVVRARAAIKQALGA